MKYLYLSLAVLFNVAGYIIFKTISHRQEDLVWAAWFATYVFTPSPRLSIGGLASGVTTG